MCVFRYLHWHAKTRHWGEMSCSRVILPPCTFLFGPLSLIMMRISYLNIYHPVFLSDSPSLLTCPIKWWKLTVCLPTGPLSPNLQGRQTENRGVLLWWGSALKPTNKNKSWKFLMLGISHLMTACPRPPSWLEHRFFWPAASFATFILFFL